MRKIILINLHRPIRRALVASLMNSRLNFHVSKVQWLDNLMPLAERSMSQASMSVPQCSLFGFTESAFELLMLNQRSFN